MSKGMSLDNFREALSSDATKENETLKKEIMNLKKDSFEKKAELKEDLKQYKEWCSVLGNRCFVLTRGTMCLHCDISACKYAFTESEMNIAITYMKKNKLSRTAETAEKVSEFLNNERAKRLNTKI